MVIQNIREASIMMQYFENNNNYDYMCKSFPTTKEFQKDKTFGSITILKCYWFMKLRNYLHLPICISIHYIQVDSHTYSHRDVQGYLNIPHYYRIHFVNTNWPEKFKITAWEKIVDYNFPIFQIWPKVLLLI